MRDEELNIVDRFLYKLLIVTFLLMSIVFLDKVNIVNMDKIQNALSEHYNILPVIKSINGKNNTLLPFDLNEDVTVSIGSAYSNSLKMTNGGRKVTLNDMEGVEIYKTGVIVKKYKNSDGTYSVTIKGIDDLEYVYDKLATVDFNIYKIVQSGEILGSPYTNSGKNYFEFYVKDNGQIIDLFP